DAIELVIRAIVAQPIARVFAEPVLTGARIDVAAHTVTDAERDDFREPVRRVDTPDLRGRGRRQALVAGRSNGHIEPAVLIERQIFPAMRNVGRQIVVDDLRLRHVVEIGFGIVVLVNLVDIGDVERAVSERDAGRYPHALDDGFDRLLAALVHYRVDDA